jgi:hypothetical protein
VSGTEITSESNPAEHARLMQVWLRNGNGRRENSPRTFMDGSSNRYRVREDNDTVIFTLIGGALDNAYGHTSL